MKRKIIVQLIMIFSVVMLAACSTPSELLRGAKFSSLQLSLLQTELNEHVELVNKAMEERKQRIIRGYHHDFDLSKEVEDQLYITGNDTESKALIKIVKKFEKRNDEFDALIKSKTTMLGGLTEQLKISTESFSNTQNALTDLATEETVSEQLDFFLTYVIDVQNNIEAQRKAEQDKINEEQKKKAEK